MIEFGRRMYGQSLVLRGHLSEEGWKAFLIDCAHAMNMNPVGLPAVYHYPVDGKGGTGMTILQPITESFLVIDTWPDFDGAYLRIQSCCMFRGDDLTGPARVHGLGVDRFGDREVLAI